MTKVEYDAIVVGARVAGASTAMLLARAGLRVLAVDRARFPSDTLSSHQLQLPGVAALRDWGLLDAVVGAGTPPTRAVAFQTGDTVLRGHYPSHRGVDFLLSPRRTLLDKILVDAARAAGAEIEEASIVNDLLTDGDQVTGVRFTPKGGVAREVRATLVIGADGKHSLVARTVGAREYRARSTATAVCYGYFACLPTDGGRIETGPGRLMTSWPTMDGLTMVYLEGPVEALPALRGELTALGGELVEHVRGTTDLPHVMRRPYGPGWTLVGDAGLVMDPITGQGIGNALCDAAALSTAIVGGLGGSRPLTAALRGFHRDRDGARRPMYDLTAGLAALRRDRFGEILFPAIADDPRLVTRFLGVLAGTEPADRFFALPNVATMVGTRGLLRLATAWLRTAGSGSRDSSRRTNRSPTPGRAR